MLNSGRRRQRKAPDSTNGWVRAVQRFRSNFRSFDGYGGHSDVNALEDEEKKRLGATKVLVAWKSERCVTAGRGARAGCSLVALLKYASY